MATAAKKVPARKVAEPVEAVDNGWEDAAPVDAEDTAFGGGLVDDGDYTVSIVKAYFRESKTSGKEYINVELQIIDDAFNGRYLFMPFYVNSDSENFRKGQKGFLAKLFESVLGEIPESFPASDEDLAGLVDGQMTVKVITEDNEDSNGKVVPQNRVVRCCVAGEVPGGA